MSFDYGLNWIGKTLAKNQIDTPHSICLVEDKAHNEKPGNKVSENILIEGENLEVLKYLKATYANSVKMIYIDPPYNTGKKFCYNDKFTYTPQQIAEMYNISLVEAKKLIKSLSKSALSHSAWLTFMYPRLYIARDLLKEDGVIFISIDDNEVAQLKLLCDEVFGEGNFVAILPWKGRGGGADDKNLLQNHEYVLMYVSNKEKFITGRKIKAGEKFPKFDTEKNRYYKTQLVRKWGSNSRREDRPNLFYPIVYDNTEIFPILPSGSDGCWRWSKERFSFELEQNNIEFSQRNDGIWEAYEKIYEPLNGEIRTKLYSAWLQSELMDEIEDLLDEEDSKNTAFGTKQVKNLFDDIKVFDYPKPTELVKILIKIASVQSNEVLLDFFGGSGTTAHAVMQLNAEDNGNRQFILVQLPEKTDEKSEAFKAGYKTIFDITKARIEKSAVKIHQDFPYTQCDLGFKIFKAINTQ
ncbi:site-specific DNA-methyltransferase [Rodentibacter caecimuris]|uniref:site-specific DNA-methyltransferase n=1 Tax=Rodentibacter caecimuris TaxID=1796644 RepID=UPI0013A09671|nr:site-specific DNA-methyltransferase [Rodentibacter heylii]QIA76658.1 site-specific DNA-methyltransferase [Rodentibacter heylii]